MNNKFTFSAEVPEEHRDAWVRGDLIIRSGAIRALNGQVAGFLDVKDGVPGQEADAGLNAFVGQFPVLKALQIGSLALQGANLAVSVHGFKNVFHRLDAVSGQLTRIESQNKRILEVLNGLQEFHEMQIRVHLQSSMANLASGLATGFRERIGPALNDLENAAITFARFCEDAAPDARTSFENPELVGELVKIVCCVRFAMADANMHLGYQDEALRLVYELKQWHENHLKRIEEPFETDPTPLWLAYPEFIDDASQSRWEALVLNQRAVPEAIEYKANQYEICRDFGMTLDELASAVADDRPVAYLRFN